MNSTEKSKNGEIEKKQVLTPGAADAAEGLVYLVGDNTPCDLRSAAVATPHGGKSESECMTYAENQPGEGYWSVAPGCADISEGRVWVAATQKKKQEVITVFTQEGSRVAA